MIKSMTGYAVADLQSDWGRLSCEIRSVNSRHLELFVRAPDEIRALEPQVRRLVQARVQRGKVEVNFRVKRESSADTSVNRDTLNRYAQLATELSDQFPGLTTEFGRLLALPGVLQVPDLEPQQVETDVLAVTETALAAFIESREREGAALLQAITQRVDGIAAIAAQAREWVPMIREAQRTRLLDRLGEMAASVDPSRLEQELVLALTKLDVDEELDRLDSHVVEARRVLARDEAVGRRLDFLLQEFNREANTLGSKSVDSRTGAAAVELKVLIDQAREQIQNIE